MLSLFRRIATPFILTAFILTAFFGFVAMSYGSDGQMQGDCPFSATGVSQCPQNTIAAAVHHLSAYQSFLNVPVSPGFSALIIMLGFLSITLALGTSLSPVLIPTASGGVLYESPSAVSYNKKLMRWLSLFENSPSFR